jgi:two-component system, chemotaxis family, protein-glutamate methylesterase/glutaminase
LSAMGPPVEAPNRRLAFDAAPAVNGHRPAVSCLLASVAAQHGSRAIGILLTGMGKDGAAELKLMKDAGAITIAQDESSSVVHGMPGEAIRSGGATYVMAPEDIGAALPALVLR